MKSIDYIFLLLALIAEIIGTIGGFGSSVFFVPIANFFFPFQTVLALIALFHLSSNLSKIALFKKGLNKKLILYLGLPSIIMVIVGGILSKVIEAKILEVSLSIFLMSLSTLFLIQPNLTIQPGRNEAISGGVLSGFIAGLLGTGGAIRGITMAAFNLEKSVFIATSAMIDFGVDFTRTIIYIMNGYVNKQVLSYVPFLFLIGFIGTYIGRNLLTLISQKQFRRFSLFLILCIGVVTLIQFIISH